MYVIGCFPFCGTFSGSVFRFKYNFLIALCSSRAMKKRYKLEEKRIKLGGSMIHWVCEFSILPLYCFHLSCRVRECKREREPL